MVDLENLRFGRLVALRSAGRCPGQTSYLWECRCDCGKTITTRSSSLLSGHTKSCGCAALDRCLSGSMRRIHGLRNTPEYDALAAAQARCKPGYAQRKDYFDRGIRVCEAWSQLSTGFLDFLSHIGKRPSSKHTLDRIDNDRGYEPGNVRWATRKEQVANQRRRARLDQFSDSELTSELNRRGVL